MRKSELVNKVQTTQQEVFTTKVEHIIGQPSHGGDRETFEVMTST